MPHTLLLARDLVSSVAISSRVDYTLRALRRSKRDHGTRNYIPDQKRPVGHLEGISALETTLRQNSSRTRIVVTHVFSGAVRFSSGVHFAAGPCCAPSARATGTWCRTFTPPSRRPALSFRRSVVSSRVLKVVCSAFKSVSGRSECNLVSEGICGSLCVVATTCSVSAGVMGIYLCSLGCDIYFVEAATG